MTRVGVSSVRIDAVVTPAGSYNLVDLADLKTLLNVQDTSLDTYFNLVIPQASAKIAQYCNQPLVVEGIQSSYYPQRDGWPWMVRGEISPLQLSRWPAVSVDSVVETIAGVPTTLVAGTDYLADLAKGELTRLDSNGYPCNWRANPIVVNFTAGYEAVPNDVVSAVVDVVKAMLYARNRDPALRSENIEGVWEAQYWFDAGPGSTQGLPLSITSVLDNYHIPVVG